MASKIDFRSPVAVATLRSKAVMLLLLIIRLSLCSLCIELSG